MPVVFVTADAGLLARWRLAVPAEPIVLARPEDLPRPGRGEVVLLDAGLAPAPEGLELLAQGRRLVLADPAPDEARGLAALAAGCFGYCHAYADPGLLRQILDVVAGGEVWVGRELLTRLLGSLGARLPQAGTAWRTNLTEREQAVAEWAAAGLSNKEIAARLDITVRTVKAHLSQIFAKLGVRDRLQLVVYMRG